MAPLTAVLRDYVLKALDTPGMKALLLDKDTMNTVGTIYSVTELNEKEAFLVSRIDEDKAEHMGHVKAVCLLRPSGENIAFLRRHLRKPHFGEYHIYFTNVIKPTYLQELAEADEEEVIQQVQEFYGDYVALDPHLFTIPLARNSVCMTPAMWDPARSQSMCDRVCEGLAAIMLSLKKRPLIRYQRSSDPCKRIASDLARVVYEQEAGLFDFRRGEQPVLVLVDRLDDAVTPLLSQWTYQAMAHELVGLSNNRADLGSVPGARGVRKEVREIVLSSEQDAFFREHMYSNYGDLGSSVKNLVDDFQVASKSSQNIQTIEDMQRFVENYPQFRAKQGAVSKHVALLSEMNRMVDERCLMTVSQLEQELACSSGQTAAFEEVETLLRNPQIKGPDRLRLVLLFALRYEKEGSRHISQLCDLLAEGGARKRDVGTVYALLRNAGADRRTGDLYGNKGLLAAARTAVKGLKGVDNVYTQHQPLLATTLGDLARARLKEADYPFAGPHASSQAGGSGGIRAAAGPREVIIFVVGGATYEEARTVAEINKGGNGGMRVLLGGTCVQNSTSFVRDLQEVLSQEEES